LHSHVRRAVIAATLSAVYAAGPAIGQAASLRPMAVSGPNGGPALIPTGQYITATAAPGSTYERLATGLRADGNADADDAVSSALSPDGKTLLVLTTGFNTSINYETGAPILFPVLSPVTGLPAEFKNPLTGKNAKGYNQAEYVFVFDVSHGVARKLQQIPIPDTFEGLAWDPSGSRFFVSGGIDDRVLIFKEQTGSGYVPDAPFIVLHHNTLDYQPIPNYDGGLLAGTPAGRAVPQLVTGAIAGGLDVSRDGKTLVVANFGNASASIVDLTKPQRPVSSEVVFYKPGSPVAQGEYPFAVAVVSDPTTGAYAKAYVTSQRDDQVMVMTGNALSKVIPVPSGPNKMTLTANQATLYVVCGNDDSVVAIDTATDRIKFRIPLSRPGIPFKGANPDDVTLDPTGRTLYVTLGGENAVAVIDVASRSVTGRIPVGWYPTSVRTSLDGSHLFAINEKSNAGPNPGQDYYSWNTPYGIALNKTARNEYTWESEKAGIVSMPVPDANTLPYLTRQVDINNNFGVANDNAMMAELRKHIKHVIYIVNENRTYDQVLGDLGNGANGDPRLAFFNQPITPNLHALAADFVTLDNFYDSSETSGVGWNWVMQGHTNAYVEETQPVDYGNSNGYGFTYDWQGIVKNINIGMPATGGASIFTTRITGILDPSGSSTILPGYKDPSASEGADDLRNGAIGGYIWEDALRAGLTVRNYGWNCDLDYYGTNTPFNPKPVRNPFSKGVLQSAPSTPSIQPITDRFYRAFDQTYPDIFRIEEWQREYAAFVAGNNMPNLMVMTIPHDHTGSFGSAMEGLGTPQLELADHDFAIGKLVETVSHSKYWASTAIVMLEDDPQDGQDHVEAHRSIVHIISPYTLSHALVHTTYTTVNALRTVETLLGLPPLGENDANAAPMSDVFSLRPNLQPYVATIPGSLCHAPVDPGLVPSCANPTTVKSRRVAQRHDAAWWAQRTVGMDFRHPDHIDSRYFNALLEYGITGRGKMPVPSKIALTQGDDD
jgi:YVTN family beta-propeller protein